MVAALAVACLIGILDYLTERDLVIYAIYLVPICWVTLTVGRRAGLVLALLSTVLWIAGHVQSGDAYTHTALACWNALMLLALLLPTVYLLSAFREAHAHLEKTVAIRTVALKNEIEERKRAESAKIQAERLAMVGTMAAQVAHEVRNPLGAIVLTLTLLEEEWNKIAAESGCPLLEGKELLSELRGEINRIDRVILDYLVLARPQIARFEVFDLNDLLRRKFAFMRGVFAGAGVELKADMENPPMNVRADGDQLWQAILNLVRNSLEAMPDGGTLGVKTQAEESLAVIELTDTGCGMTLSQQERLFIPFVTSKANGTGLGLALVQQIISENGGKIRCSSAPGESARFTISLPLHREPRNEEAETKNRAVPA